MTFPLTTAAFTALAPNSLDTDALQLLLDAAEEEIIERAGPTIDGYVLTSRTEQYIPRGDLLMLSERASSIVEVIEHAQLVVPTTLVSDDYELTSSGYVLRRLRTGTNGAYRWFPLVSVEYIPYSDNATRSRVQSELVKLSISFSPGLASQTIGSWTESYASSGLPYDAQRAAILATLHPDGAVIY